MSRSRKNRKNRRRKTRYVLSMAKVKGAVQRNGVQVVCSLIFLAGVIFFGLSMYSFIFASDYFNVQEIEVVDKNPAKVDYPLARLQDSPNIFRIDLKRIERRLEREYPDIQTVSVSRILPDKLLIEVLRRQPIGQIELPSRKQESGVVYYSVNEEGYVLAKVGGKPYWGLPVIQGVCLREQDIEIGRCYVRSNLEYALSLRSELKKSGLWEQYSVTAMDVKQPRELSFVIDRRIEVKIGNRHWKERLEKLAGVMENNTIDYTRDSYVDLRFKDVAIGKKKE